MKKYKRHLNSDEFLFMCSQRDFPVNTERFEEGGEHIVFWFEFEGVKGRALYNVVNGLAFGTITNAGFGELEFSTDHKIDGYPWFDALLAFIYRD